MPNTPPQPLQLPLRHGVGASTLVLPSGHWPTLLDFLCGHFKHIAPQSWRQRMQDGLVCDGQGQKLGPESRYCAHQRVYYYRELADETPIPFSHHILYRDEHLMAVDKPHFLPATPAGNYVQETLLVRLKRETGLDSLAPIHRLDRETAGVMLFCIQAQHRHAYQSLFARREVHKTYWAIAASQRHEIFPKIRESRLQESSHFMQMQETSGPANSHTHIALLTSGAQLALYQLQPTTGKKHQLRVHMNALGIPILNDSLYPQRIENEDPFDYSNPLQLLAKGIAYRDPISGQAMQFESQRTLAWQAQAGLA